MQLRCPIAGAPRAAADRCWMGLPRPARSAPPRRSACQFGVGTTCLSGKKVIDCYIQRLCHWTFDKIEPSEECEMRCYQRETSYQRQSERITSQFEHIPVPPRSRSYSRFSSSSQSVPLVEVVDARVFASDFVKSPIASAARTSADPVRLPDSSWER